MNRKDKLIESTLLALQGKLNLNESNKTKISSAKQKKTEDVEVETDTAEVTVGEDTTIIDTDEATVTVEKNTNQCVDGDCVDTADDTETFDDTPLSDDGDSVEVPVEGNDTIVPDEDIPVDDEDTITESKEQTKHGEVPDEAYDIAKYIKNKFKGQKTIARDEFDTAFDEAKSKFAKDLEDYDDLETDVRSILGFYGYTTDYENGDLTTESKQRKTKGVKKTEDVDPRPNETKMLELIDDGAIDTTSLAKELLAWLSDDDVKRFMQIYEYNSYFENEDDEDLDESKKIKTKNTKCDKEECDKPVSKYSSKTFNEALTNMYKSKYKTVESFKTTKVKLTKNTLKIEGKIINIDGIEKPIKLEMKKLNETKSFTKYQMRNFKGLLRESKNSTLKMMTRVNKDNVLECKYVITK